MKQFTVYTVYMDDNDDCYKVTVPAENAADAIQYLDGHGEVIAVKEAPLQNIDLECLAETLTRACWGQMEIDVITRTLEMCGLQRF